MHHGDRPEESLQAGRQNGAVEVLWVHSQEESQVVVQEHRVALKHEKALACVAPQQTSAFNPDANLVNTHSLRRRCGDTPPPHTRDYKQVAQTPSVSDQFYKKNAKWLTKSLIRT